MDEIVGAHLVDPAGNPAGGHTENIGMVIDWQNGPLGRGADRKAQNGALVEEVIWAAIDRLLFYQVAAEGKFACFQNDLVIELLRMALDILEWRTKMREARGVEGTHVV